MARSGVPSLRTVTTTDEYFEEKFKPFVEGVPKMELHAHIGGSVDPLLAWDLIKDSEGEVVFESPGFPPIRFDSRWEMEDFVHTSVADLRGRYEGLSSRDDLMAFLWKYNAPGKVFKRKAHIPIVFDKMVGAYAAENTMHVEFRTAVKAIDKDRGVSMGIDYTDLEEMEAYAAAIEAAREKYGMSINLILCMRRGNTDGHMRMAERTLELAKAYKKKGIVVGVDLAGAERGNPARKFSRFFHDAHMAGLQTTIHGGEAYGDGSVEQIIEHGLADRVGHGVAVRPGSKAFELAWAKRIPFEVCVTSNVHCGAFRTDPRTGEEHQILSAADHPIREMMNRGICVTVNCDNREVSNTSLTQEFFVLNRVLGLHRGRVIELLNNSIHAAFLEPADKIALAKKLWAYADEYEGLVNP